MPVRVATVAAGAIMLPIDLECAIRTWGAAMVTQDDANLLRVAAIQMNSRDDKSQNIETALRLIDRAAGTGARLVALPEVWAYLGPEAGNRESADSIPGPAIELLAERARRHGIYLHGGSI